MTISGDKVVDMMVVLEYSSTIFKPWLSAQVDHPTSLLNKADSHPELAQRLNAIVADFSSPDHIDYSRKDAVVYLFENIHAGNYRFDIHQSFKSGRENCQSVVGLTVKTWEEGRALNGLDKMSFGTMHLY